MRVAVDSSVPVGLIVPTDTWHGAGKTLVKAVHDAGHVLVYLDCVAAETASAVARRLREKGRPGTAVQEALDDLASQVPVTDITWVMPRVSVL